jgi:hypothetical protein
LSSAFDDVGTAGGKYKTNIEDQSSSVLRNSASMTDQGAILQAMSAALIGTTEATGAYIPDLQAMDEATKTASIGLANMQAAMDQGATAPGNMSVTSEAAESAGAAIGSGASDLASSIKGPIGDVTGSAIQGFQQGGPWAALIAAIFAILSQLENFTEMISIVNEDLGKLFEAIDPVLDVFSDMFEQLSGSLQPIFAGIGEMFASMSNTLKPLWEQFNKGLAIIKPLMLIFQAIGGVMRWFKPVFEVFGEIVKGITFVVTGFINLIIDAITEFVRFIQDILGWTGLDLSGMIKRLQNARIVDAVEDDTGGDLSDATDDAAEQTERFADRVREVNESLTNGVRGIKLALHRYQASVGAPVGAAAGGTQVNITTHSVKEAAAALDEYHRFQNTTSDGSSRGGSQFGVDRAGA